MRRNLTPGMRRLARRSARLQFLFSFFLLAAGCARHAENSPLQNAQLVLGPVSQDVTLQIPTIAPEVRAARLRAMKSRMSTADYLRIASELHELAVLRGDEKIDRQGGLLWEKVRAITPGTLLGDSLYADAAIGEGEEMARPLIKDADTQLKFTVAQISSLLDQSVHEFPWPREIQNLPQALSVADAYVAWMNERIPGLGLKPELQPVVQDALNKEYQKFRPGLVKAVTELSQAHRFAESLAALNNAVSFFKVELKPEQKALFGKAAQLSQLLDSLESPQDVLTMLIFVWRAMPPEQRIQFRSVSPDFFDFLKSKNDSDLSCLAAPICVNPLLLIPKGVVINKIAEFGVANIQAKADSAALSFVLGTVKAQISLLLPTVPGIAKEQVLLQTQKYAVLLKAIQADYVGFTRTRLKGWGAKNMPAPILGLFPSELQLEANGKLSPGSSGAGAESLGLSLNLASAYLPSDPTRRKSAILEPLLKLLSIGGFRQAGGAEFPSLLFALDGKAQELFNIHGMLDGRTSFAVPDSFSLSGPYRMNRALTHATASVAAQAELLRGISKQIRFLRDWEKNEFDSSLGAYHLDELVPEIPYGTISFPMFPKNYAFAIAVGDAGAMLQNIIRDLSPAFLLLRDNEVLWGNRYKDITGANISTVAGMVPIVDGKRVGLVKTRDLSLYILALNEFLNATEGVENTKSKPLLDRSGTGQTVLEQLQDARRSLRLFQMALTNYLVYVNQQKNGVQFSAQALEKGLKPQEGSARLEDQALAIRALLASARSLELPVFRWAALDTYYGMNRKFFSPEQGFYTQDDKLNAPAGIHEVAIVLLAGEELSGFMPSDARQQWERLTAPWLESIRGL